MAKKDKVVDLKPKAEKISEEHLKSLQEAVSDTNNLQMEVGKLEAAKHLYLHKLAVVQDSIKLLQETLEKEYGTCNVSINDGSINYPEDEE